jgi:TRAP-type C4-dicarboxylate transport system permease small subunit
MRLLRIFDRTLTVAVSALLVLSFAIMLGLAALQVLLRFFFHTGIPWGDIAARNLVLWVGFFGAYHATRENKHFRIDVLTRFLLPRIRYGLFAFTDLFAAVVTYYLLRASLTFVSTALDPDAVAFLGIPQAVIASIVPLGFGLIIAQFLMRTLESAVAAVRDTPANGEA